MSVRVPAGLAHLPDKDETWQPWLASLPRAVAGLLADWELTVDGAPAHGQCSLVVPVLRRDGVPGALKVTWPHREAEHEHLALQHWHGDGAVELFRADPRRWALLLERAGSRDASGLTDVEACALVGRLLARVHRPAPPQLVRLSEVVADWAARLLALPRDAPVPRRLVEHAASLGVDLSVDPGTDGTLLHTDAHYANVLAAEREPWLLIDPKPLCGDPHYEPAPLLWNRWAEVVADPAGARVRVRRRLEAAADALGLDWDRARAWVVVREMCEALWLVEAAVGAGRSLTPQDSAELTRAVTIAKAVQD